VSRGNTFVFRNSMGCPFVFALAGPYERTTRDFFPIVCADKRRQRGWLRRSTCPVPGATP